MNKPRPDTKRQCEELFAAIDKNDAATAKRLGIALLGQFLDDVGRLADAVDRLADAAEELT